MTPTLSSRFLLICFCVICIQIGYSNDSFDTYHNNAKNSNVFVYTNSLKDKSLQGQIDFITELLTLSNYIIKKIDVYQTLSNYAKVFHVKLEPNIGVFIFVRWDKKKKENFIANKLIDPGVYYSLKVAKEIMRKQTDQRSFGVEDIALQAPDQEKINVEEIRKFRQEFELHEKEKQLQKIKVE